MASGMASGTKGKAMDEAQAHLQKLLIREAGKYYQAFLGAGNSERASSLARQIIGFTPSADAYAVLVGRAILAGSTGEARKLIEDAGKVLPESALELVKAAEAHPDQAVAAER